MLASASVSALTGDSLNWHLLFARQPEPDLEFTEEDLDEAAPPPAPPMRAPKRSGKSPLKWILILLVLGGIGYAAYDPDSVMQLVEPYLGNGTDATPPPPQMPQNPQTQPQSPTVAPPTGAEPPVPAAASAPTTAPAASAPTPPTSKPAPAIASVAGPAFSEGQRVTVIPNPARPGAAVPLYVDPAGTKTATTVPATATLTILDGELQNNSWVYAARTEDGRKGWIPERSLNLKR